GQERQPRERIAARRSRARDPRGEKAASGPDRQWQRQSSGRGQGRGLAPKRVTDVSAPELRGAFVLGDLARRRTAADYPCSDGRSPSYRNAIAQTSPP